jgi:hypothetical protein
MLEVRRGVYAHASAVSIDTCRAVYAFIGRGSAKWFFEDVRLK